MNGSREQACLITVTPPLKFNDTEVHAAIDKGGIIWVGSKDVCQALGIEWQQHLLDIIPFDWKAQWGGELEQVFISELGVYQLAFRSVSLKTQSFVIWLRYELTENLLSC